MWGADTNQLPDAFWKADIDEAVGRLVAHIRRFRPHVVVTYDGIGGYGHPDHIQTHRVTLLAVEAAHHRDAVSGGRRAMARVQAVLHVDPTVVPAQGC